VVASSVLLLVQVSFLLVISYERELPRPQFSTVIVARVGCDLLQVESRVRY
jgi:hypothetical protein